MTYIFDDDQAWEYAQEAYWGALDEAPHILYCNECNTQKDFHSCSTMEAFLRDEKNRTEEYDDVEDGVVLFVYICNNCLANNPQ